MMRAAMKSLVFASLLILGFGAQSVLACAEGEAGAHHVRTVASDSSPTAADFDRVFHQQRCDCPAPADVAQVAVTESEKFALIAFFDGSAASPEASFAELRRCLYARGVPLSGALQAPHFPPYLLTERLRL